MWISKNSFLLLTLLFFIILPINKLYSQTGKTTTNEPNEIRYQIKFISEFSNESDNKKNNSSFISKIIPQKSNNGNWFSDLLFGKTENELNRPISVLALTKDSLIIFDQGIGKVFSANNNVGEITQFKNQRNPVFPSLVGSSFLNTSEIVFTDSKLNQVYKYNLKNNTLFNISDSLLLHSPTGIACSPVTHEIWVVETSSHRVIVLDENGNFIKYVGQRGTKPGEFNYPTFIWIDKMGIIYVIDTLNFRVQMFDKNGKFLSTFGEAGNVLGSFARPKGIATDSYGNIYVVDALFNNVQIFDKTGKLLYVFGTKGTKEEEFWLPTGIYIDHMNYIYIADSYNSRVQVFQLQNLE